MKHQRMLQVIINGLARTRFLFRFDLRGVFKFCVSISKSLASRKLLVGSLMMSLMVAPSTHSRVVSEILRRFDLRGLSTFCSSTIQSCAL
jgi:hypothetical protein